jgi:hypothetical protein
MSNSACQFRPESRHGDANQLLVPPHDAPNAVHCRDRAIRFDFRGKPPAPWTHLDDVVSNLNARKIGAEFKHDWRLLDWLGGSDQRRDASRTYSQNSTASLQPLQLDP